MRIITAFLALTIITTNPLFWGLERLTVFCTAQAQESVPNEDNIEHDQYGQQHQHVDQQQPNNQQQQDQQQQHQQVQQQQQQQQQHQHEEQLKLYEEHFQNGVISRDHLYPVAEEAQILQQRNHEAKSDQPQPGEYIHHQQQQELLLQQTDIDQKDHQQVPSSNKTLHTGTSAIKTEQINAEINVDEQQQQQQQQPPVNDNILNSDENDEQTELHFKQQTSSETQQAEVVHADQRHPPVVDDNIAKQEEQDDFFVSEDESLSTPPSTLTQEKEESANSGTSKQQQQQQQQQQPQDQHQQQQQQQQQQQPQDEAEKMPPPIPHTSARQLESDTKSADTPADSQETPQSSSTGEVLSKKLEDATTEKLFNGKWGSFTGSKRYANLEILGHLFHKDLADDPESRYNKVFEPVNDLVIPFLYKDIMDGETVDVTSEAFATQENRPTIEATTIGAIKGKRSVNSEFVEGLDDIDKLFEVVDPPDEFDIGASGTSIQDVLMGQTTKIIIKRVKIGAHYFFKTVKVVKMRVTDYFENEDRHLPKMDKEKLIQAKIWIVKHSKLVFIKSKELLQTLLGDDNDLDGEENFDYASDLQKRLNEMNGNK